MGKNQMIENLSKKEMLEVNGGIDPITFITLAGAFIYVYNNADDFVEGFKCGYND